MAEIERIELSLQVWKTCVLTFTLYSQVVIYKAVYQIPFTTASAPVYPHGFVAPTHSVYQGVLSCSRVIDHYSPWFSIAKHAPHGKQCSPTHIHPIEDSGDGLHTLIIFDNQKDVTQQNRQVAFC